MIEGLLDLASAFGLSTSAGLNAYIPLLTVAVLGRLTNLVELEGAWATLTSWWIIGLLTILLVIEIVADKVPAVDTMNDVIQTFIRPTAGAILFAAQTQTHLNLHPVLGMACGVILAGGVHAVKAGARPVLTATTGGVANPVVSTVEDIVSAITSFIAVIFPYLIIVWLILLIVLIVLMVRHRRQRRERQYIRKY
ncbi:MAG: DUF4126 domain-containing protein [Anaerolineae bacterium]|nr:DUF4126 domain-containing protein [Anaerolineae bacterium]